ncbi:MAG TPA: hypothetical protein PLH98_18705 [Ruminococcus flavefaciens]|nr:hypothetical protein [Ruminococcus flavefaciens]HQM02549.1 hypothetical protein [Ruminococcus flavefaciens]
MIHAVILDKEDNFPFWKGLSFSGIDITLLSDTSNIPCCDTVILSEELNGRPIEENYAELRQLQGFKSVPAAAVTYDHGSDRQDELLEIGFDDVLRLPLCDKLIARRIEGLAAMLPYTLSSDSFSFESLIDIRDDGKSGAFSVQSDDLSTIYRFVIRILQRLGTSAQVLLLKLACDSESLQDKADQIMQILANDVRLCLRRGDIASVCGKDQIVVLLIGADDDGGHLVANRIVSSFYSECDDDSFTLEYDIHEIKT